MGDGASEERSEVKKRVVGMEEDLQVTHKVQEVRICAGKENLPSAKQKDYPQRHHFLDPSALQTETTKTVSLLFVWTQTS